MKSKSERLVVDDVVVERTTQATNINVLDPTNELSDAFFRVVANCTYDWESWHAPDGRLIWVNSAVERVTGYAPEECVAMDDYPQRMVAPDDREAIGKMVNDAKAGSSGNDMEFQSVHRNGEKRWMAVSWQPMYDESNKYLGFRTSVRDITDRRQLRDQIRLHAEHLEQLVQERTTRVRQLEVQRRQMEKLAALGRLAAGVAHEVNNPLAGIRNAFELIKSGFSAEHKYFDLLELIDTEIERISSITHQLHQLYQRTPPRPKEFIIEQTVYEVTTMLESVAIQSRVTLDIRTAGEPTPAKLPEGEVKQILFNLICNAIQASPAGGSVTVSLERTRNEVCVIVIDRGTGIAEDVLSHIFEPFFTTKESDPEPGMGLGLSVSRSLIESMGGSIDVHTKQGEGSRFTAHFPLNIESAPG